MLDSSDPFTWLLVRVLAGLSLASVMFSTGLSLGTPAKSSKKREWGVILRGLVLNLILVPCVVFFVTRALHVPSEVATALLLLAASPGGRYVPQLARIARADVPVAVEGTLLLAKITAFSAPFVASQLLDVSRFHVSELRLLGQLVLFQLVPYIAGRAVGRYQASLARYLHDPLNILIGTTAVAVLVLLVFHGGASGLLLLGTRGLVGVAAVTALSFGLGFLLGGPRVETRSVTAMNANAPNLFLGVLIAIQANLGPNVQAAMFGAWFVFLGFNCALTAILRARAPRLTIDNG